MDLIYNKKGFIKKSELVKYNYSNLIFETIPFKVTTPEAIKDIHEVQCIIKVIKQEEFNIKDKTISIISGEIKLIFVTSKDLNNETAIISTLENFIIEIDSSNDNIIEQLIPLDIYFTLQNDLIFGKLLCISIKCEEKVEKTISNKEEIIKSLFL